MQSFVKMESYNTLPSQMLAHKLVSDKRKRNRAWPVKTMIPAVADLGEVSGGTLTVSLMFSLAIQFSSTLYLHFKLHFAHFTVYDNVINNSKILINIKL